MHTVWFGLESKLLPVIIIKYKLGIAYLMK